MALLKGKRVEMVYTVESEGGKMMEEDRTDEIISEVLEHWDDEDWEVPD